MNSSCCSLHHGRETDRSENVTEVCCVASHFTFNGPAKQDIIQIFNVKVELLKFKWFCVEPFHYKKINQGNMYCLVCKAYNFSLPKMRTNHICCISS